MLGNDLIRECQKLRYVGFVNRPFNLISDVKTNYKHKVFAC